MKNNRKWIVIALSILLLIGTGAFLWCFNQEGFTGSRVKYPDSYLLDIARMHGTDQHSLELQAGDVLQIQFEAVRGSMYMEIKAPDGTSLYRGNGKTLVDFSVNIPETGIYTVAVQARHAGGKLRIQKK